MQSNEPELASVFWAYQRLSAGERAERLAAEGLFWAWEQVSEAMTGPLPHALDVLDQLLAHPDADPVAVGAGPLEDLLLRTDARIGEAVATRCNASELWRRAAGGVGGVLGRCGTQPRSCARSVPSGEAHVTSSPVVWFGVAEGRNAEEAAFLAELRRLAALWDVPDLDPDDDTSAEVFLAPLFIGLDVPGVTAARDNLQLAYGTGAESWLTGEWGTGYLLDDHDGNSPECLTVRGVQATPEEFARFAADWMLAQLQRPLAREDWLSGDVPHATRWRFTDNGHVLDRDGLSLRRVLRRQPDRVVLVRGRKQP